MARTLRDYIFVSFNFNQFIVKYINVASAETFKSSDSASSLTLNVVEDREVK